MNTLLNNLTNKEYEFVNPLKPSPKQIKNHKKQTILSMMDLPDINSVYGVGLGLGDLLVNMKLLRPNLLYYGGCVGYKDYLDEGDRLFGLSDYDFDIRIQKFPEEQSTSQYDLVFTDCIQSLHPHKGKVAQHILNIAYKYIVVQDNHFQLQVDSKTWELVKSKNNTQLFKRKSTSPLFETPHRRNNEVST